jgi:serine/threonine protein phosphatase PrpC
MGETERLNETGIESDATARLNAFAAVTDVGLRKQTNQDAHYVRAACTPAGKSLLAVVCDGVGGLSHGEMASALVVQAFADWYLGELAQLDAFPDPYDIARRWGSLILGCNADILARAADVGAKIGTTVAAILIYGGQHYIAVNVGDSRIYHISSGIRQVTRDHTVAADAVEKGELTKEEAAHDRRRSVLTKCVGTSKALDPDFYKGSMGANDLVLLCSDGFYGKTSEMEMFRLLSPFRGNSVANMDAILRDIIDSAKIRGEKDNITAILTKLE